MVGAGCRDGGGARLLFRRGWAGNRFWIYRSGDGVDPETGSAKWFLHGIYG
jgi:hypothetical protein